MRSILAFVLCFIAAAHQPAEAADAWIDGDVLSVNGEVSRRIWKPEFASAQVGALRLSVGLALGLRGAVRDGLDRQATPALMLEAGAGASLALLPAGSGQVMLIWSQPVR